MTQARTAAFAAHAAAREQWARRKPTRAAGHAVAVAHMADHELGAAAYAIRAAQAEANPDAKVRDEMSVGGSGRSYQMQFVTSSWMIRDFATRSAGLSLTIDARRHGNLR